ncbi:hypothetical protein [Clostridium massiliamazoniense]|uniref:hypothetical protein n=1 Tax=Clostridium massiliamazoniense TaxID=1347366 RepID=UPI0006D7E222|nr:hypothetical protein [Clostridium massiliamazoniense]
MKNDILEVIQLSKDEYLEVKSKTNNFFNITGEKYVLNEINAKTEDFLFNVKFLKLNTVPIIVGTDSKGRVDYASIDGKYLDTITEEKATEAKEVFMLAKNKIQEFTEFAVKNNIK